MDDWKHDPNSTVQGTRDVSRQERQSQIAALLRERESCDRRGLVERVKLIDAELARWGHEAATPEKRAERRPASTSSQKR